jgi:hypothetical protein
MADQTSRAEGGTAAKGITKMEAVRRALALMGREARPAQMQSVIRDKFGVDMTPDLITKYKSDILSKAGKKRKGPGRKPAAPVAPARGPKPAAARAEAAPAPAARGNGKAGGIPLEDVLTVKELVGRLGAESVRTLIDAFAR